MQLRHFFVAFFALALTLAGANFYIGVLLERVQDDVEREQARIGQEIHDGLCQQLVSLAFDANTLQRELAARRRPEAKTAHRIAQFLDQAITESRQLSPHPTSCHPELVSGATHKKTPQYT